MQDIYIGNLPYTLDENGIKEIFDPFGDVNDVTIIKDHQTGKKTGYAFVKMNDEAAKTAIEKLDKTECHGRTIRVNNASSR